MTSAKKKLGGCQIYRHVHAKPYAPCAARYNLVIVFTFCASGTTTAPDPQLLVSDGAIRFKAN